MEGKMMWIEARFAVGYACFLPHTTVNPDLIKPPFPATAGCYTYADKSRFLSCTYPTQCVNVGIFFKKNKMY